MCLVRIVITSGVLMHNHTVRSSRNRLAVLAMAFGISILSIASVNGPATHAAHPGGSSAGTVQLASETTPNGVFGWD
jgi:hypothetical protein